MENITLTQNCYGIQTLLVFILFFFFKLGSAGIGRTGTILVVDMILETIDTLGEFEMFLQLKNWGEKNPHFILLWLVEPIYQYFPV